MGDKKNDNRHVKTVTLSNNDRFYFSWKYDEELIAKQINEARCLYASFAEIPILPDLASQIEDDIIIRSIHGTAAIEGNPLSEKEVQDILTQDDKTKAKKRAEQEIFNLEALYQFLHEQDKLSDLSEALICTFHKLLMTDIDSESNKSGQFRSNRVFVGDVSHGGTYKPPSRTADIRILMNEFVTFINSTDIQALDPVIRGALAHFHLALIHPFGDGNGRTARFLEAYIIRSAGMKYVPELLSNYYYHHMDDYYWAFSLTEKNKGRDITPFLDFVYKGVIDSLSHVKNTIYIMIQLLTLRNYLSILRSEKSITQRQYDLLSALGGSKTKFSLPDLITNPLFSIIYRSASPRTAQRDLKKLSEMNLLKKNEDGSYELNLRALG